MLDFSVIICYNIIYAIYKRDYMRILTLTRSDVLASNCYIVISGNSFSVIDPSVGYEAALTKHHELSELSPRYVILTHGHIDHFWEIESYVRIGCSVIVSLSDASKLSDPMTNCSFFIPGPTKLYAGAYSVISEGDSVDLGDESLTVMHTPGHTSGSVCLIGGGVIFSGDTLFAGGAYGRYDLPSGDGAQLFSSISRLLGSVSDAVMYSGHGDRTDIESVKKYFDI